MTQKLRLYVVSNSDHPLRAARRNLRVGPFPVDLENRTDEAATTRAEHLTMWPFRTEVGARLREPFR